MTKIAITMNEIKVGDTIELAFVADMGAPLYGKQIETVKVSDIKWVTGFLVNSLFVNGRGVWLGSQVVFADRAA